MFKTIREDIQSVFDRDPAARNGVEVFLNYASLHALWGDIESRIGCGNTITLSLGARSRR